MQPLLTLAILIVARKSEGKRALGKVRNCRQDTIKIHVTDTGCMDVEWTQLVIKILLKQLWYGYLDAKVISFCHTNKLKSRDI